MMESVRDKCVFFFFDDEVDGAITQPQKMKGKKIKLVI